jgi:hypothetical protein
MTAEAPAVQETAEAVVGPILRKARAALAAYENHDQARVDEAVTALAWSIYKPENARGRWPNWRWRIPASARRVEGHQEHSARPSARCAICCASRTVGVIEEDPARGLVKYGKPVGVVAAVCPSTNPAATPVNKAMMALKGGNAVVIAPSPSRLRHHRPDGGADARGAEQGGLPRGSRAGPAGAGLQGDDAGADGRLRPRGRHRLAGQRAPLDGSRAPSRSAWAPAMCRSSSTKGRSRRCGREDHGVEDLRQRHLLLLGERGDPARRRLRGRDAGARASGRAPRQCRGEGEDPLRPVA